MSLTRGATTICFVALLLHGSAPGSGAAQERTAAIIEELTEDYMGSIDALKAIGNDSKAEQLRLANDLARIAEESRDTQGRTTERSLRREYMAVVSSRQELRTKTIDRVLDVTENDVFPTLLALRARSEEMSEGLDRRAPRDILGHTRNLAAFMDSLKSAGVTNPDNAATAGKVERLLANRARRLLSDHESDSLTVVVNNLLQYFSDLIGEFEEARRQVEDHDTWLLAQSTRSAGHTLASEAVEAIGATGLDDLLETINDQVAGERRLWESLNGGSDSVLQRGRPQPSPSDAEILRGLLDAAAGNRRRW